MRIVFDNGAEISAEQSGTTFITDAKPDFPSDFSLITVYDNDEIAEVYHNAELIEIQNCIENYMFAFREIPATERRMNQLAADMEYLAMMSDIELEVQ